MRDNSQWYQTSDKKIWSIWRILKSGVDLFPFIRTGREEIQRNFVRPFWTGRLNIGKRETVWSEWWKSIMVRLTCKVWVIFSRNPTGIPQPWRLYLDTNQRRGSKTRRTTSGEKFTWPCNRIERWPVLSSYPSTLRSIHCSCRVSVQSDETPFLLN